jgi:ABC-type branched-subunit amino acid transport system substrate-binding protein
VFPHAANEIMRARITAFHGQIVGEEYILLGSRDVKKTISRIVDAKPDVILNTINGDTNIAFFTELRAAGITPRCIPTMSFSIAEDELASMDPGTMAGDYAVWNYFQSINSKENLEFVARFKSRHGADRHTSDPIEAGYLGVYLWAKAVKYAGTDDVNAVRKALAGQTMLAPEGIVVVDAATQHTWKTVRIGQIRADGQFETVWTSQRPMRPVPYPPSKSKQGWDAFLGALFQGWGNRWANPGAPP